MLIKNNNLFIPKFLKIKIKLNSNLKEKNIMFRIERK